MSRCNSCQTTPNPVNLGSISSAETLATNLQDHGWSPIFVDLQNSPPSREEILSLFQSSYLKDHSRYIYRSEESGAEGETSVEPKESIEVRLRGIPSDPETMIEKWCISLSEIAHRVCEYLDLPPDTMLAPRNYPETLDLMRVFHYYGTTDRELGSSPHTDWGSLTIVWQDSVGGLETYCRCCKEWIPVPPPILNTETSSSSLWHCIVHVGDMASLALGNETGPVDHCSWPSPKHRVLTSKQERVSLVFFGYPPPFTSIEEMRNNLKDYKATRSSGKCLPLEEYYLLKDQSEVSKGPSIETVFSKMVSTKVFTVIQKKWLQVQRSADR